MENNIGGKVLILSCLNDFNNRFYDFKSLGVRKRYQEKLEKSEAFPQKQISFVCRSPDLPLNKRVYH